MAIAGAYVDCCLAEGRKMADVVSALHGSSTLDSLRREAVDAYIALARSAVEPLVGPIDATNLQAVVGAGDAPARGTLDGKTAPDRARVVLARMIVALLTDKSRVTTIIPTPNRGPVI